MRRTVSRACAKFLLVRCDMVRKYRASNSCHGNGGTSDDEGVSLSQESMHLRPNPRLDNFDRSDGWLVDDDDDDEDGDEDEDEDEDGEEDEEDEEDEEGEEGEREDDEHDSGVAEPARNVPAKRRFRAVSSSTCADISAGRARDGRDARDGACAPLAKTLRRARAGSASDADAIGGPGDWALQRQRNDPPAQRRSSRKVIVAETTDDESEDESRDESRDESSCQADPHVGVSAVAGTLGNDGGEPAPCLARGLEFGRSSYAQDTQDTQDTEVPSDFSFTDVALGGGDADGDVEDGAGANVGSAACPAAGPKAAPLGTGTNGTSSLPPPPPPPPPTALTRPCSAAGPADGLLGEGSRLDVGVPGRPPKLPAHTQPRPSRGAGNPAVLKGQKAAWVPAQVRVFAALCGLCQFADSGDAFTTAQVVSAVGHVFATDGPQPDTVRDALATLTRLGAIHRCTAQRGFAYYTGAVPAHIQSVYEQAARHHDVDLAAAGSRARKLLPAVRTAATPNAKPHPLATSSSASSSSRSSSSASAGPPLRHGAGGGASAPKGFFARLVPAPLVPAPLVPASSAQRVGGTDSAPSTGVLHSRVAALERTVAALERTVAALDHTAGVLQAQVGLLVPVAEAFRRFRTDTSRWRAEEVKRRGTGRKGVAP